MCKKGGESIAHLLLHAEVAKDLWVLVLSLSEIEWPMPQRMVKMLASWTGQFGSHYCIGVWRMVPLFLMWCIWRECNARNFENCERIKSYGVQNSL
jgi:hypothetical protein